MSRAFFEIERGLSIVTENTESGIQIIFGDDAPDGVSGDQGVAQLGSLYLRRTGTPELYVKRANNGNAADYVKQATTEDLVALGWRPEQIVVVTGETLSVGVKDATTFTDDDGTTIDGTAFTANVSHVIGGAGTTPVLYKVTNVAGNNITLALADTALITNDTFVVKYYLPDIDGQENQAIVNYTGSIVVKLSDIDWAIADAISLSISYAAASGNITSSDTVDSAIRKLDGNIDAVNTLTGVGQGVIGLGTFTGAIIPDDSSIKAALQALESSIEGQVYQNQVQGSGAQILDEVLVDNIVGVKWMVYAEWNGLVDQREIDVVHDGTPITDATNTDQTVFGRLRTGSIPGLTYTISLSGTGLTQVLRLTASATNVTRHKVMRVGIKL